MSDQLSIKLNIAGRSYPLTIERHEEEAVRKAARNVNQNIQELQENYAVNDKQDLLAMVALQFATQLTNATNEVANDAAREQLEALNNKLGSYLNS